VPKKQPKGWRYKGDRFTERRFLPYATAIGQVALAWNDLHEAFAMLFCTALGGGWIDPLFKVWNSLNGDRAKRDMLRVALLALREEHRVTFPTLRDDLDWLWARANEVATARNNAIHSPLFLTRGALSQAAREAGVPVPDVLPQIITGNKNALRLELADLLDEFRWCRKATLVLRDYTRRIDRALSTGRSWPDRPKWSP
jgi:hypothetical protein